MGSSKESVPPAPSFWLRLFETLANRSERASPLRRMIVLTGCVVIVSCGISGLITLGLESLFPDLRLISLPLLGAGLGVVCSATIASPMILFVVVMLQRLRTARMELKTALAAAEVATVAKSAFLANMSHEIRTPLNGVLGMAQALDQYDLPAGARDMVFTIKESGHSLMTIVNDVLDLSKIEAGKFDIVTADCDLPALVGSCVKLFEPQAAEKGLALTLAIEGVQPPLLRLDPVRLRQCVSNLISNAVKFTRSGGVAVRVTVVPHGDGFRLAITVADTGIGMTAEQRGRLFQSFSQGDETVARDFGGTGLGLAISRKLARLMGGDIVVESEAGKGSTFTLTASGEAALGQDSAPSAASGQDAEERGLLQGRRVLVVDDNAVNRKVARLFLEPHGAALVEATNGQEALDRVSETAFDLILLDVHMPVMGGVEVIQRIRGASGAVGLVPVIALTADAMLGERERLLALGMSGYVSKPIDMKMLLSEIARVQRGVAAAA